MAAIVHALGAWLPPLPAPALTERCNEGNHHFARDWAWEDRFVPAAA